jgi:hypothetical protein
MLPSRVRARPGPDPIGHEPLGVEPGVLVLTRALNPD